MNLVFYGRYSDRGQSEQSDDEQAPIVRRIFEDVSERKNNG